MAVLYLSDVCYICCEYFIAEFDAKKKKKKQAYEALRFSFAITTAISLTFFTVTAKSPETTWEATWVQPLALLTGGARRTYIVKNG